MHDHNSLSLFDFPIVVAVAFMGERHLIEGCQCIFTGSVFCHVIIINGQLDRSTMDRTLRLIRGITEPDLKFSIPQGFRAPCSCDFVVRILCTAFFFWKDERAPLPRRIKHECVYGCVPQRAAGSRNPKFDYNSLESLADQALGGPGGR